MPAASPKVRPKKEGEEGKAFTEGGEGSDEWLGWFQRVAKGAGERARKAEEWEREVKTPSDEEEKEYEAMSFNKFKPIVNQEITNQTQEIMLQYPLST